MVLVIVCGGGIFMLPDVALYYQMLLDIARYFLIWIIFIWYIFGVEYEYMSKVLIIEDDENLRDIYREEFEREGFIVETANDGEEGIAKLASFVPDILLLDILMPGKSGFDVLKSIKDNPPLKLFPILVLTNIYTDTRDLVQNWGVSFVLLKVDYTPGQIVAKVRELLKS